MSPERLNYLVSRFFTDACTDAEKEELMRAYNDQTGAGDEPLRKALEKAWLEHEHTTTMPEEMANRIQTSFPANPPALITIRGSNRKWWAAAAIFLLTASSLYLIVSQRSHKASVASHATPQLKDIAPGGNKAILTLSNGQSIILDSAANGLLAQQGNATVTKLANGQLAYGTASASTAASSAATTPSETMYNSMSTPPGGQYRLILPDGTAVWLNSASSITYPVAFTGKERSVRITGEAYFEVTKNKTHPFRVQAGEASVQVLGTSFNINAYSDENSINTTLVEGAVKIAGHQKEQVLAPGQQAQLTADGITLIPKADVEQALAWKNGIFAFRNADVRTVMRQLSRWYNVEVTFAGTPPKGDFSGEIGRSLTLTQVLNGLSQEKIHFEIKGGNKIIVQP